MSTSVLIKGSLECLDYLKEHVKNSANYASVKDQIQTLKIDLKFLRLFFECNEKEAIYDDKSLEEEVRKMEGVIREVEEVIRFEAAAAKDMDGDWLTYILEKIELLKPKIGQQFEKSICRSDRCAELIECVLDLIHCLSEVNSINIQVKKLFGTIERRLLFLRHSIQFLVEVSSSNMGPLCDEITYTSVKAASFFFSCWINKMDPIEQPDLSRSLNYNPGREETSLYKSLSDPYYEIQCVGYIDFLFQRLGEVPTMDQFESLHKYLKLLRSCYVWTPLQDPKNEVSYKQFMADILNKVACLVEHLYVGNMNEEEMMTILTDIATASDSLGRLELINIFCGMELVNHETNLVKDQFETIDRDMQFFRAFFIHVHYKASIFQDYWNIIFTMDGFALDAGPFLYTFYVNETKEDNMVQDQSMLPDLLEKINLIKDAMRKAVNIFVPFKETFDRLYEEYLKHTRTFPINNVLQAAEHGILYDQLMGVDLTEAARLIKASGSTTDLGVIIKTYDPIHPQVLGRLKLINIFRGMKDVHHEPTLINFMEDQFQTLLEDMHLLRIFYYNTKDYEDAHRLMDTLALENGSLLYSLCVDKIRTEEMDSLLPDLLAKTKLIKADIRRNCHDVPSSNFPESDGQRGAVIFLIKDLNEKLNTWTDKISPSVNRGMRKFSKPLIDNLQCEVEFLIPFVEQLEERCTEMGSVVYGIRKLSNQAYYATHVDVLNNISNWSCMLQFCNAMEEVRQLKKEVARINGETLSTIGKTVPISELFVGFKDEAENIIDQLVGGSENLQFVSIVGMGGLGKTTLTKKLYNNPKVSSYFDRQAWTCVSQEFQKRELLLDILRQVDDLTQRINQNTTDFELIDMLFKSLKGRRYLIVIDDIWDIKAWTALSRCFKNDRKGSRIVFTTRNKNVALSVQPRNFNHIHSLRFFRDEESLDLLVKNVFLGERCPRDQLETVEQIAKHCKGLPLAVVVTAGILAAKKIHEWEEVAESLKRLSDGDLLNLSNNLLELSYNNLPEYLRTCFLYFGGYPEDKEIPVKKLMWLWVAEGFTHKDTAEEYLMDLINRSLVTVAKRGYDGRLKTCRIHDVLLDFCLAKAKQENVLLLVRGKDDPSPHDQGKYRMCIYSKLNDVEEWPSRFNVRSLVHFGSTLHMKSISSYVSFITRSFKSLNVLDLERLLLKDLDCGVELLDHLRLLSVRIQSRAIPESISKLSNLETFIVKGIRGEIAIPNSIWSMINLRHLHIDKRASLVWDKTNVKDAAVLDKLETLSTPCLPCGKNSMNVISLLPNLLKLKCIFLDLDSGNNFPDLQLLEKLESLEVMYYGSRKVSHATFSFPLSLKKLTLSKFQLPWSDLSTIGKLPNLEVLKLLVKAYDGEVWEIKAKDDELTEEEDYPFKKLKYLKLEGLDIKQWTVDSEEEHFPFLEKLVVHGCKQLEEIPLYFADSYTLNEIEVKWCNISTANSAIRINNERLDNGKEGLNLILHPNPLNLGVTSSSF